MCFRCIKQKTCEKKYENLQTIEYQKEKISSTSMAELLQSHSDVYIKSYGLGSIATLSIRGSSSNQNLLLWNEVPVDNPMLGLSDISLIQNGALKNASLLKSSSEDDSHFETIGAIVKIETSG